MHTHGSITEVEVEQVFILDLCHLDDGLIVHALCVRLDFGPHQLVPLVGVEALAHGQLLGAQLMPVHSPQSLGLMCLWVARQVLQSKSAAESMYAVEPDQQ